MKRTKNAPARVLLAICTLAVSPAALAQSNDSILSRHVKEADGTTAQDTNTGSGIKTGHLQNGAVTAAKLAPAAVGTAAIADGAVTSAKIAGPIPAAKIDRAGLDADTLDGRHASELAPLAHAHAAADIQGIGAYQRRNRSVVVVAKDGTGDFTDPAAALASITDASESNPYLVKVMPGVYAMSGRTNLVPWVDLEGSGENVTRLVYRGTDLVSIFGATEIRDLTIEGEVGDVISANPPMTDAPARITRATVLGGMSLWGQRVVLDHVRTNVRIYVGINGKVTVLNSDVTNTASSQAGLAILSSGEALVESSRITLGGVGQAFGISNEGTVTVRNTTIRVDADTAYGIAAWGATTVEGSAIVATGRSVSAVFPGPGSAVRVANTRVEGPIADPYGSVSCFNVYGPTFAPVTCP